MESRSDDLGTKVMETKVTNKTQRLMAPLDYLNLTISERCRLLCPVSGF